MDIGILAAGLFPEHVTIIIADLLDGVGFSSDSGIIALDIVARGEGTVIRNDLARFEKFDIPNGEFLDVDDVLDTRPDDLGTLLSLVVVSLDSCETCDMSSR